jgi:putative DNA primase/helicase
VPRCRYYDDPPSWHPAMIAMITGPDGRPTNLQRTYLTTDGRKAEVSSPRKMMSGSIANGATVRLAEVAATLGIAEGIETALSATALFGLPCWAALNKTLLQEWMPPQEVRRVVIFSDNDASFAGQAAAHALAQRLAGGQFAIEVEVRIPSAIGQDWNDVHQAV